MTSIVDFYAGRTVLVTGATGFMGKVLLEKLLRSCPTITRIYVLIRPKKGFCVEMRLTQLLESKVILQVFFHIYLKFVLTKFFITFKTILALSVFLFLFELPF